MRAFKSQHDSPVASPQQHSWMQRANFMRTTPQPKVLVAAILSATAFVCVIGGCQPSKSTPAKSASADSETDMANSESAATVDHYATAAKLLDQGKLDEATVAARKALLESPDSPKTLLLSARVAAAKGDRKAAEELAAAIGFNTAQGPAALEFRVQLLQQLGNVNEAANLVLQGLQQRPRQTSWRHLAWSLLNYTGRREEASQQAEILCREGQATDGELLSLVRRTEAFPSVIGPNNSAEQLFAPGLGQARWHFTNLRYREALDVLDPQMESGFESSAACAMYGRLLAETQAFERFPAWYARCNEDTKVLGDYWAALGTYFFDQRKFEASAKALLEALYINPTDRISMQRLSKVFAALNRREDEEQFRYRAIQMAGAERDSEALMRTLRDQSSRQQLTRKLLELGRPFETLAWTQSLLPANAFAQRNQINAQRSELLQSSDALSMASESALIGISRDEFDMQPALADLAKADTSGRTKLENALPDTPLAPATLSDVANQHGIDFQWYPDNEINIASIPIHESVGGGIAVIDFDLDGWPDVYFAQGAGDPPSDQCDRSNVLLHNVEGDFTDVSQHSDTEDFNYGAGLSAGDLNQDGFPDLYLGSLGHNRILINNGDGTFRDATDALGQIDDRFTSSLAIADINNDGLPDLFEGVYIEMEGAFKLPDLGPDGQEIQPSPLKHYAQSDRWFENLGDGNFRLHDIDRSIAKPGTSLGVMVTDFDGDGKNEVFVGNDVRPNHFLVQDGSGELQNAADIKGVANGYTGSATGCMGITQGDFDHDGRIDLHITNFSEESANLYMQVGSGDFVDLAVRYDIDKISLPNVGFGTKAIDIDRNGWLDLFVTNGHIFDMRHIDEGFQMAPQFMYGRNGRFELAEVEDASGYWDGLYLGRSMTSLDYNRDGSVDLLIGHLERPTALLENKTPTQGNWIQLELVGTTSERDAIGTRVVVTAGGKRFTSWVTSGDGYFCSDEPMLDVAIGTEDAIDSVEIFWPSGIKQTYQSPQPRKRYLAVEGGEALQMRSL
ncbi:FG-GAP-like repeat-containing protein [Roseiconus sp. JC912]|uniref:FG-GAP-like repeat-containing protein n=2 Tax=Pirellulaceae TaxID=2691357 RepID=UPI003A4C55D9